jgi:hypothetical protein
MVTSLCIYRVKPGSETAFKKLLAKHWPTLRRVGLAADKPSKIYQGSEGDEQPIFVELLNWKDENGAERAHELPDVMAVWEPMGKLCEERAGRPSMEFPLVEPIEVRFER